MKHSESKTQHIFICTGKDCAKRGCEGLKTDIKRTLKENKLKKVKLIKTKCMDYCKLGPNLSINGQLWHECKPADIPEILDKLSMSD